MRTTAMPSRAIPLVELAGALRGRRVVVVGNGESRLELDLSALAPDVVVFGCNALYRDFTPHYLGAVDERMTEEIVREYRAEGYTFIGEQGRVDQWRSADGGGPRLVVVETESDRATGPMMLHAAAHLGCDPIYLLGFDVAWTPRSGRVNSVYRDAPLYAPSAAPLSYHVAHWQKRLGLVFAAFPGVTFRQIGPSTLPLPQGDWEDLLR